MIYYRRIIVIILISWMTWNIQAQDLEQTEPNGEITESNELIDIVEPQPVEETEEMVNDVEESISTVTSNHLNNNNSKKVTMRFNNASLDQVLSFISKITGLTVIKEVEVMGNVTIISEKDISVEDAIDVLNSALAANGYTAIRMGNLLKIVSLEEAKSAQVRVQIGKDPEKIKQTDEIITQIMPLQYADAGELKRDLATLISRQRGDLSASVRSNTLIVTDVASNVRRIAEIVQELDAPQASVTQIRVFTLRNADAQTLANTLNELFKPETLTPQTGSGGGPGQFFRQFTGGGQQGGGRGSSTSNTDAADAAMARSRASVKITVDNRTNSLVVSAPAADMMVIDGLVQQLDKDETEPEGTMVIHLQHGDAASLSQILNNLLQSGTTPTTQTGGGGGGGFIQNIIRSTQAASQAKGGSLLGQVKIASDKDTNSLIFITSPRNFARLREMVESLDFARPQVMIEVLIAERTMNDETQLGVEWSFSDSDNVFGEFVTSIGSTSLNLGAFTNGLHYTVTHENVQGVLKALKKDSKLNILSTPRILTFDNSSATIKVGERVPFLTSRQVTDTGSIYNSYQYQDVGITLTVTPHINPDGYVSMNVHPVVSKIGDVTFFDAPVIANREANTEVMVKDGETVIIGGLMKDDLTETVNKVPLLGDIPLLGYLFKSTDRNKEKTELMVFLTPRVVRDAEELRELSEKDKAKFDESTKVRKK